MDKKKIVIIGATSAMAEHCARLWVQQGQQIELTLVGRNANRIKPIASDLQVRSPQSDIRVVEANFLEPSSIQTTVDSILATGTADIVLIAHGSLPEQTECQNDLIACRDALAVNGISPVLYAEAFVQHMAKANHGTLVLIGSVAGDRGRKSNYVYGSAKGLVTRYAQGLQHRFAGTAVKVVLVKPGPTDTPMTAHLKSGGSKLASVAEVAQHIVDAAKRGQPVAYVPGKWRVIMMVIRHLPRFVFNKLNI